MDAFMVASTEPRGPAAGIYIPAFDNFMDDDGVYYANSAEFSLLDRRLDMGLDHLHGCTSLVVVSQEAVYMSHYL